MALTRSKGSWELSLTLAKRLSHKAGLPASTLALVADFFRDDIDIGALAHLLGTLTGPRLPDKTWMQEAATTCLERLRPKPRPNEVRPKAHVTVRDPVAEGEEPHPEPETGILLHLTKAEDHKLGQSWATVLWDGDREPSLCKASCLEYTNSGVPLA